MEHDMKHPIQHHDDEFPGIGALFGIDNSQLGALVQLANLEMARGALDDAIETLTVLTDLDPFSIEGWMLLSETHQRKGNEELAHVYREFAKGIEK